MLLAMMLYATPAAAPCCACHAAFDAAAAIFMPCFAATPLACHDAFDFRQQAAPFMLLRGERAL